MGEREHHWGVSPRGQCAVCGIQQGLLGHGNCRPQCWPHDNVSCVGARQRKKTDSQAHPPTPSQWRTLRTPHLYTFVSSSERTHYYFVPQMMQNTWAQSAWWPNTCTVRALHVSPLHRNGHNYNWRGAFQRLRMSRAALRPLGFHTLVQNCTCWACKRRGGGGARCNGAATRPKGDAGTADGTRIYITMITQLCAHGCVKLGPSCGRNTGHRVPVSLEVMRHVCTHMTRLWPGAAACHSPRSG